MLILYGCKVSFVALETFHDKVTLDSDGTWLFTVVVDAVNDEILGSPLIGKGTPPWFRK